ncbi:hypothetical protein A5625_14240 [Mycobacterium sp. 1465703.0]|nr:hypothetical protein A5625_14240 [Mycobacterium sp. 1465703.0]
MLNDDTWSEPHVDVLSVQPEMTYADAYELQFEHMRKRVAGGDRIIGYKAAGTSLAARDILGDSPMPLPIVGTLLSSNLAREGAQYVVKPGVTYVESEIAVVLSEGLAGPHVNDLDASRAIGALCPAIEIAPWSPSTVAKQRSEQHAIATQKTDGLVVIGAPRSLGGVQDLHLEGVVLTVDGRITGSGTGAEVMGSPLSVVSAIARHLSEYGLALEAGMVVMTGSITKPLGLPDGSRSARAMFTTLGSIGVRFTNNTEGSRCDR